MTMGELDSSEEGYRSARHTSSKEESFKGSNVKCSVGTMNGTKANVHDSITRQFAVQIGQKHGLARKKLVETGEETIYKEPPHPTKREQDKTLAEKVDGEIATKREVKKVLAKGFELTNDAYARD